MHRTHSSESNPTLYPASPDVAPLEVPSHDRGSKPHEPNYAARRRFVALGALTAILVGGTAAGKGIEHINTVHEIGSTQKTLGYDDSAIEEVRIAVHEIAAANGISLGDISEQEITSAGIEVAHEIEAISGSDHTPAGSIISVTVGKKIGFNGYAGFGGIKISADAVSVPNSTAAN